MARKQELFELKVLFDQSRGLENRNERKRLRRKNTLYQSDWLQQIEEQVQNENNSTSS